MENSAMQIDRFITYDTKTLYFLSFGSCFQHKLSCLMQVKLGQAFNRANEMKSCSRFGKADGLAKTG